MPGKLGRTKYLESLDLTRPPKQILSMCHTAGFRDTTLTHVYLARKTARNGGVPIPKLRRANNTSTNPTKAYLRTLDLSLPQNILFDMCIEAGHQVTKENIYQAQYQHREMLKRERGTRLKEARSVVAVGCLVGRFKCTEEEARSAYAELLLLTERLHE